MEMHVLLHPDNNQSCKPVMHNWFMRYRTWVLYYFFNKFWNKIWYNRNGDCNLCV